jgi:hypothetical protein
MSKGRFLNNGFIEMLLVIVGILLIVSACAGHKSLHDESDLAGMRAKMKQEAHSKH